MHDTIVLDGYLNLQIELDGDCDLVNAVDGECGIITEVTKTDLPIYTGTKDVIPLANESQVLPTSNTILLSDMKVEKIPYYETSNINGTTVYIGDE